MMPFPPVYIMDIVVINSSLYLIINASKILEKCCTEI